MSLAVVAPQANHRGRVDWRFLLPISERAFGHLVLLGGTAELAERVVETGVASYVSAVLPAAPTADAVVVLSGAAVPFGAIARGLVAGGALYYEIDRRRLRRLADTPGRIQRQLVRAGLTPTGVYWAAPNFAHCRRYIPLDTTEALPWYLSALYVAGSPLHRLVEIGMRLCLAAGPSGFAAVTPCYAVTAIASPEGTAMPAAPAHPAFAHLLQGGDARPMVITSGQDDGSRTVILPFRPGRRQPTAVVKVAAHAHLNGNTDREQLVLSEIHRHLDEPMRRTIPRPLGLRSLGHMSVALESCASGQSLVVSSGRWPASLPRQLDDLHLAVGWLTEFHRQTQSGPAPWDAAAYGRWVEAPLAAYAHTFGLTPAEAALFGQVRAQGQALFGSPLPVVWMHYDFGPWNLFRDKDAFTVIDWEFGRAWENARRGPAIYDLLYFVTYWYYVVQRLDTAAAELEGLRRLFIAPAAADRHAAAAHHAIAGYLAALDIDARFVPLLLVCMWVEQGLHRFARRAELGEAAAEPRADNRCVRYLGVLAEQPAQLFAAPCLAAGPSPALGQPLREP